MRRSDRKGLQNWRRRVQRGVTLLHPLILVYTLILCSFAVFLAAGHATAAEKLSYKTTISGLKGGIFDNIRNTFKEASLLESQRSETLVSVANLRARVKSDIGTMNRILRAEGYYDGHVTQRLARKGNHFQIALQVTPGPLYNFGDVKIDFRAPGPANNIRIKIDKTLTPMKGAPALASAVLLAETQIVDALPEFGFPFAKVVERDVVVDHRTRSMNVTFIVDTGSRQRMGVLHFKGLKSVKERYLQKLAAWKVGDFFEQNQIENLRMRLNKSRLFSRVTIDVAPADGDRADVIVTVIEAKHRTVSTAAGYSTAEGVSGEISWNHRNFFNRGNRLKLTARGAEIEQSFESRLEISNFIRLDQTLSISGAFKRQDTDAFFAHVLDARAGIDRAITPNLALFAGVEFEYSDITDAEDDRDFFLSAVPIGARWDSSNDLFDPTRGVRASFVTAPSTGVGDTSFAFLKSELRASAYYPLVKNPRVIAALRVRAGSIIGAANDTLPATRRFFSGGGGSIRGFEFQRVGPLDVGNDPLGGRSVAEIAAEIRTKVTSTIGVVPFIEGGNVYVNEFPKFSNFRWATGIGVRYHTSFGPVRFDVALPLGRRPGEGRYQFYISLGQAF